MKLTLNYNIIILILFMSCMTTNFQYDDFTKNYHLRWTTATPVDFNYHVKTNYGFYVIKNTKEKKETWKFEVSIVVPSVYNFTHIITSDGKKINVAKPTVATRVSTDLYSMHSEFTVSKEILEEWFSSDFEKTRNYKIRIYDKDNYIEIPISKMDIINFLNTYSSKLPEMELNSDYF